MNHQRSPNTHRRHLRWSRLASLAAQMRADLLFATFDLVLVSAAYIGVMVLRFDGTVPSTNWDGFYRFLIVALVVHLSSNWAWGLYGRLWRHASIQEARQVVLGGIDDLPEALGGLEVHQVVLAIPSADHSVVRRAVHAAEAAGLPLRVLPSVADLMNARVSMRDVRDLRIEDLLGRQQVTTDLDAVRRLLEGRRVLITGAGGSIGSEIARQVSDLGPASLILVDHDETHLYDVVASLDGPTVELLGDIREADLLDELFDRHRPQVVFHAAAHKHVPLLEDHPCEAITTNVLGTRTV